MKQSVAAAAPIARAAFGARASLPPSLAYRLVRNPRFVAGSIILGLGLVLAITGPWIAPDANKQVLTDRLLPPDARHPFGTDDLGRDLLGQAIWGARVTFAVSLSASVISVLLGLLAGLTAGFLGGVIDNVIMRITDVFLAFPIFVLLLTIVAIFGSGVGLLIVFIGLTAWPQTARLVRAETLSLATRDFVLAARAVGAANSRIMFRHMVPHLVPLLSVTGALRAAAVILVEAGLSYFGLGVPPTTPTWGGMAAAGRGYLDTAPWITSIPGVLIVATVLAYNALGDGLRQEIDPRRQPRRIAGA